MNRLREGDVLTVRRGRCTECLQCLFLVWLLLLTAVVVYVTFLTVRMDQAWKVYQEREE